MKLFLGPGSGGWHSRPFRGFAQRPSGPIAFVEVMLGGTCDLDLLCTEVVERSGAAKDALTGQRGTEGKRDMVDHYCV
jgi:hypothetical protein